MNNIDPDPFGKLVGHGKDKPILTTGSYGSQPIGYTPIAPFRMHQEVYLKHREEKRVGIVIAITFRGSGVLFEVSWPHLDGSSKWHYPVELTAEYEPVYS